MKVKAIDAIVKKWQTRASAASPDYQAGVQTPKKDWAANTAASANSWQQGVQLAAANGTFATQVTAAGNQTWQNGALTKGVARYADGVSKGQAKYQNKIGKFITVLSNLTLNPRGPKGDPANYQRSAAVGTALHQAKLGK